MLAAPPLGLSGENARMPEGFPEGFALRPPSPADAEAIMDEESIALIGVPVVSMDWLVAPWTAPGRDLERDFGVVESRDGDLAGYFFVESDPPHTEVFTIGVVAIGYHGRGLGAAILAEAERRARRRVDLAPPGERVVVHAGALAGEPNVAALLTAHGYVEVRRFARMRIDFDDAPSSPAHPAGIEIRPLVRGEESSVYACIAEAFSDHWGATWPTEEAWLHEHVEAGEFHPDLWQLAWDRAQLAGVLIARPQDYEEPTLGHVTLVGVRRAYRRRGIGEALLRTSFVQLHSRGCRGAALGVDTESITGATRLYERLGMVSEPRFSAWEKELRPADA
ncbi:MAG: GNAT family N-acetyltransferase [Actinoallomurus sp.]